MQAIIGAILGALGRFFADKALSFVALKAVLVALFVTFLPTILKNLIVWFMTTINTFVQAQVADYSISSQVLELTGLTAWFAQQLQIPMAIGLLLTAASLRMVLNFVPFVK